MAVPHGLARCLRVLVMWNTTRLPHEIQHVYLREAQQLRPDRVLGK
jgi:chorismate mutase